MTKEEGIVATINRRDSTRDEDTFPNFFGTSAAAPNAAAVAALMLEANVPKKFGKVSSSRVESPKKKVLLLPSTAVICGLGRKMGVGYGLPKISK
ncbi:MAG: S8 family serine peptidase [Chloroflexota bacterium]